MAHSLFFLCLGTNSPFWNQRLTLLLYSLYLRNQRPKRDRDIIHFFLANMFICKDVIVRIVRYIVRLLPKIQQAITDYNERKDNRLIRIFHEFTGYCNSVSIVIMYKEKIKIRTLLTESRRIYFSYLDPN
jgi:hypothetical protein